MLNIFSWAIFLACFIQVAISEHFRGGTITWKPVNPTETSTSFNISFYTKFGWSTSRFSCDATSIANKELIGDIEFLECEGCINSFNISGETYCTDFDTFNEVANGDRTQYSLIETPANKKVQISYFSCCWAALEVGGNSSWSLITSLDLNIRNDTNKINSSPISLAYPVITLKLNKNNTLRFPYIDPDGDRVKCRLADSNEADSIFGSLPGVIVDEDNCLAYYMATTEGLYGLALQIEDYSDRISSTTPLSSVPLQVLVRVVNIPGTNVITTNTSILVENALVNALANQNFSSRIYIYSDTVITQLKTISPSGFTSSEVKQDPANLKTPSNQNIYYVDVSWTPDRSQAGLNLFCYQGVDEIGDSSPQTCARFNVIALTVTLNSPDPIGIVNDNIKRFMIQANLPVQKGIANSYIRFFDRDNNQVYALSSNSPQINIVGDRQIVIDTTFDLKDSQKYYILIDQGFVKSVEGGVNSNAITNQTFWVIEVVPTTILNIGWIIALAVGVPLIMASIFVLGVTIYLLDN